MIVVVALESKRLAGNEAVAVIDAYLPRVGDWTWSGHISREGAYDLRRSLRKIASRTTVVSCHVTTQAGMEPMWVVGRRSAIDSGGNALVSATTHRRRRHYPPLGVLLLSMVGLAGLFHDLGKLTIGFQRILLASVLGKLGVLQPVHHSMVSIILLKLMLDASDAKTDAEALVSLTRVETLSSMVDEALRRLPGVVGDVMRTDGETRRRGWAELERWLPDGARFPFLRAVALSALTHHRLPSGLEEDDGDVTLADKSHVNRGDSVAAPEAFLTPHPVAFACLEAGGEWAKAVAVEAEAALLALVDGGLGEHWVAAAAIYGRTALIAGDHMASASKLPGAEADDPDTVAKTRCFANTMDKPVATRLDGDDDISREMRKAAAGRRRSPTSKPTRVFADSWSRHTLKVRRSAKAVLSSMPFLAEGLPGISQSDLPPRITARAPLDSRFAWQDRAATMLAEAVGDRGSLSFLVAGTGSGKTLAAAKLSAAGTSSLRLNVLLGLRSLTLQTGDEYASRDGFKPEDTEIVVGSVMARLLHGMEDAGHDRHVGDLSRDGFDGVLPLMAERMCDDGRQKSFLGKPILVGTIDTLMPAADARQGNHVLAAVRLGTADLVIDEIDAYGTEDVIAVSRLVFWAAAFGRRVIVSSATTPPWVATSLYTAYEAGRRHFSATTGATPDFVVGWFSETNAAVLTNDGTLDFPAAHQNFVDAMVKMLAVIPPRRRMSVLDTSTCRTEKDIFAAILDKAVALHEDNHVVDERTGRRVSIGFVRFNRIASCRSFAAYALDTRIDGVDHAVVCYHSRFALAVRHCVERTLASLLTRKPADDGSDPLLSHPLIRKRLDDGKDGEVMVLVVTTPIMETGRDWDGDWGITEPCSPHSATQFSGRLSRHRMKRADAPNMVMLDRPLNALVPWLTGPLLTHPGVESPVPLGTRRDAVLFPLPDGATAEAFDLALWAERLDATVSLAPWLSTSDAVALDSDRGQWMVSGEHSVRRDAGANAVASLLSVTGFISDPRRLWDDCHPSNRPFRRSDGIDVEFYRDGAAWHRRHPKCPDGEAVNLSVETDWEPNGDEWKSRLLLPLETFDPDLATQNVVSTMWPHGAPRWAIHELSAVTIPIRDDASTTKLYFHPVLGGHYRPIA